MPKHVRNFWATIETPEREVSTGPRSKDGWITINLKVREEGDVSQGVRIHGYRDGDELVITIDGQEVKRVKRDDTPLFELPVPQAVTA